jgi:glucose/arabinose dehydrogenase
MILATAFIPWLPTLLHSQESAFVPQPTHPDLAVQLFLAVENNCIRIVKDPSTGRLHYLRISGEIYEIDWSGPTKTLVSSASDHGITSAAGFAISSTGMFFLVGNITQGSSNIGIIKKGEKVGETRVWTTVAQTVPYPLNQQFNHNFNAIAISPDGNDLFVNSGARTDHGEAQFDSGDLAGVRELPITTIILRIPITAENLILESDENYLIQNGYQFARGVRNHFDLAFAANGDLFGTENSGDRDDAEELNWIREGRHYGFPWRMGTNDTPQQFPGYDPDADPLVSPNSFAYGLGFFHDDPTYPPPPQGVEFTDPVSSRGPDADKFREPDGTLKDASNDGETIATFTPHRVPLGLVFDTENALGGDFTGDAFVLCFGTGSSALGDPSNDLLHLELDKIDEERYELTATSIVRNFSGGRFDRGPVDAALVENKLYVIETGAPNIWQIMFPANPTSVSGKETNPGQFSLSQSYPNPFNPTTTIDYQLSKAGQVCLSVYNAKGQLVATLVNEKQPAGSYSLQWNASGRVSGTFFYQLQVDGVVLSRKMLLLK